MEKMAAGDSIEEEAEFKCFVINIPPHLPPAEWPECCIYRVPKNLRKVNKEAYTPQLVSIGPFHHGGEELRDMEIHKLRYLRDFFEYRTGKIQEDLLKIIKENEEKIRHCYSETFEHNSKDFVKMILLDAIFIIEIFLRNISNENDYIRSKPWLDTGIRADMLLLENQLPFFVIEKLYMFAFNNPSSCNHHEEGKQIEEHKRDLMKQDAPFLKLSRQYFSNYDEQPESIIGEEVQNFPDLLRYFFCSVPGLKPTKVLDNVYCVTKLDDAGLKFKAFEKRRLLDITFPKNKCLEYCPWLNLSWLLACLPCLKCFPYLERMQCILEVPTLKIYDNTEAIFRNIMALEQCHYPSNTYICNYAWLMDYLIDTDKDVELLVEKNIIVNNIGSNAAVATLFNKLCIEIVEVESCYYDLGRQINGYLNPWNRTMAIMKSVYFRDFWRGTATVIGLLVLIYNFYRFLRSFHKNK